MKKLRRRVDREGKKEEGRGVVNGRRMEGEGGLTSPRGQGKAMNAREKSASASVSLIRTTSLNRLHSYRYRFIDASKRNQITVLI